MTVGDLLRRNAGDPACAARSFLRFEDTVVTHAEYYEECCRWANLFIRHAAALPPGVPADRLHVGILLDNTPDYFFALGGAALAGAVAVGINNTKRGSFLAQDIAHTDCRILITEPKYLSLLAPVLDESGIVVDSLFVSQRWSQHDEPQASDSPDMAHAQRDLTGELAQQSSIDPQIEVGAADPFVLVFTSGTVTAPKAVVCSHGRMVETGKNVGGNVYQLTPDDVGYIAMPLFHANALMCGFLPALYYGASLGMIRKFSKRQWLSDIRHYGTTFFNYTGKPLAYILATPPLPDDHRNSLRICYGNEGSHQVVKEFEARFDCRVIDVFGSSEGGAGVTRQPGDPPNSIGLPAPGIIVVDEQGLEKPRARFADSGRLLNTDEAIGEIVNTAGTGWFEGYYKNADAFRARTRNGWYWSGDLGYRDDAGYLYFAGRDIEWIRVDGENFVARPIEEILQRHPDVILAAVYGVPDADGGDRVMAALMLRDDARLAATEFALFLAQQADLSPKWIPTYLRLASELPQTATAKILKTTLRKQKFRPDWCRDPIYWRRPQAQHYEPFTAADWEAAQAQFGAVGRSVQLDL